MAATEQDVQRSEARWAVWVSLFVLIIFGLTVFAALVLHRNPPSNLERIDPKTLHLSGEFTEPNLGTRVEQNGQVTTRIVATLVSGTNVNTMVVPGYVSQVHTVFRTTGNLLMPCHEFCGFGHSQMLARVRVVPAAEFRPDTEGRVSCAAP